MGRPGQDDNAWLLWYLSQGTQVTLLITALILATLVGWRVAKRGGENPAT